MSEAFPNINTDQWREELLQIDGISRVSMTPSTHYRVYPELVDFPELGIVFSDSEAIGKARAYYRERTGVPLNSLQDCVRGVQDQLWVPTSQLVGARDILDYFVGSEHIENAAVKSHEAWFAGKQRAFDDQNDPFQGFNTTRRKVKDLSDTERQTLGIPSDADPSKDVYHHLFRPYIELSSNIKDKNVVPMAATCLAVGDFLLTNESRIEDLDEVISNLGKSATNQAMINMVTHVAWAASDITLGGRPSGEAAENYHLYNRLSPEVQDLDAQASTEPLSYIRDKVAPIAAAYDLMKMTLFREGGPFEEWWAIEHTLLFCIKNFKISVPTDTQSIIDFIVPMAVHTGFNKKAHEKRLPDAIELAYSQKYILPSADGILELTNAGGERLSELKIVLDIRNDGFLSYIDRYSELKDKYSR